MSRTASGAILDALPFALTLLDRDGTIVAANTELERLLLRRAGDLVGKNFFAEFRSLAGVSEVETSFRRGMVSNAAVDLSFDSALVGGEARRGPSVRVVLRSFEDEQGRPRAIALFATAGGSPVRPRDDLATAAEVAAGVKHDVNNLLMGLLGHLTLLLERAELAETTRAKIELLSEQARRIRDRITDLDSIRKLAGGDDDAQKRTQ